MREKKYWLWVDGQKKYYDYPPEPLGYTPEQLEWMELMRLLYFGRKSEHDSHLNCDS